MKNEDNPSVGKFLLRSQLQVDASQQLKRKLKQIALRENTSLKEVVLNALAAKYPELELHVQAELSK